MGRRKTSCKGLDDRLWSLGSLGGGVLVISLLLTNQLTELKGRKAYNDWGFQRFGYIREGKTLWEQLHPWQWQKGHRILGLEPKVAVPSDLLQQALQTMPAPGVQVFNTEGGWGWFASELQQGQLAWEQRCVKKTESLSILFTEVPIQGLSGVLFMWGDIFIFQVEIPSGLLITAKSIRIFYINFVSKAIEVHRISVIYPDSIACGKLILPQDFYILHSAHTLSEGLDLTQFL